MAMYRGHAHFNLLIALPILLGGMYYFMHPHTYFIITFASTFIYSTLFMNPDLDLANQIRLFSVRGILSLPFRSYAKFFSHRGLSHNLIFGSLTRIAWLMGWALLFFLIIYKTMPEKHTLLKLYKHYQPFILYGFAGICLADWGHLLLDMKESK